MFHPLFSATAQEQKLDWCVEVNDHDVVILVLFIFL